MTDTTAPSGGIPRTRMRIVLASILFLTLLISYLDRVNVSILVADPHFLKDMGIAGQPVKMGMLMSVFLFSYGIANIITGPIGDKLGPRRAMIIAVLFWAVSLCLGGIAGTFTLILGTRILLGVGEGMHWPMQSLFVKNWFPPSERGKANAAWVLGLMVGPALAMPTISYVVQHYGWRSTFFVLAAVGLIPVWLIAQFTRDHPRQSTYVNEAELSHIEKGLEAEAAAMTAKQASATAAGRTFLADYRFWLVTIGFLSSASMWWGTMAWLPSYLKAARGFSWAQMGSLSSLPYILGSICVVIAGIVSDKVGRRAPLAMGALAGTALFIFLGARATGNLASAYLLSVAIGFIGFGASHYWAAMQGIVPTRSIGSAAGVMNGVASFGSAFVPMIVGYLIHATGSYVAGLMFLVGIGCVGALCMLILTIKKL